MSRWYRSEVVAVLALFACPPLGAALIWLFQPWRQGMKAAASMLSLIGSAGVLVAIVIATTPRASAPEPALPVVSLAPTPVMQPTTAAAPLDAAVVNAMAALRRPVEISQQLGQPAPTRSVQGPTLPPPPAQNAPSEAAMPGNKPSAASTTDVTAPTAASRATVAIGSAARLGPSAPPSPRPVQPFTDQTWGTVTADPASYIGFRVLLNGQVFNIERDQSRLGFQIYTDIARLGGNTVVIVAKQNAPDLNLGDQVEVRGQVTGAFTGENPRGISLTLPKVQAESVKLVSQGTR